MATGRPVTPPCHCGDGLRGTYRWAATTPSDIVDHVPTLRWLAATHRSVVEFGVRTGVSTAALRAAGPEQLTSYDISAPPGWLPEDHDFRQVDVLAADPVDCDLLFIDTVHTYEQLSGELNRHAAGVTATIVLHDTHIPPRLQTDGVNDPEGMWAAINEHVADTAWQVVVDDETCNGLTVLARLDDRQEAEDG